jgi:hypothetical protein
MSEPVDQASIVSQVRLFKKTNGQEEDVTAAYNISVVGEIITLQGSADLVDNSDYSIHLYPGLKATSGNTLLQGQSFQYFLWISQQAMAKILDKVLPALQPFPVLVMLVILWVLEPSWLLSAKVWRMHH